MNVVALAGGVGGAKLAHGLAMILPADQLTVIVNTGDDFTHLGLRICPDLDTVCYTLAGLANPVTGWGRADESWRVIENLVRLGGPGWFNLGDQDLATHLERTRRLNDGARLSEVTRAFCAAWGVGPCVLPMSDEPVSTWVETSDAGSLPFQDYFVRLQCAPIVTGFVFREVEKAAPAPGVLDALERADVVIVCPSNPWVSIGPILSITGIREKIEEKFVVAVSPIVGGKAIKGPAAKMYSELGIEPSALAVARQYRSILSGFIFDQLDEDQAGVINTLGLQTLITDTVMKTVDDRRRLAEEILLFCKQSVGGKSRL
jgi:LPPG:FO 2-phospho-L-lactate transferase